MAWKIEFDPRATRELEKLDGQVRLRILKVLRDRIAPLTDPRSIGEALVGKELGKYWKYRVGDWRVIAEISDAEIRILVVRIGNRREIYRR